MLQLTELRPAPPNRCGYCPGDLEEHLSEGAVIVAFGLYLLSLGATEVELHPDGEHGKRFDFAAHFHDRGFVHTRQMGSTTYGGVYEQGDRKVLISCTPGLGDVTAKLDGNAIVAECKGGVLNSSHAGQQSRLRKGLCEAVGLLMCRPVKSERHIAVVPDTNATRAIAQRMLPRVTAAQIAIMFVDRNGAIAEARQQDQAEAAVRC
jgi:hypothetical protein